MITNESIAEYFSLLAKLMDIHGENSFKSKSFTNAAFQIDRAPTPLAELDTTAMAAIPGIGANTAAKIKEILTQGSLAALDDLIQKTPEGILEMMKIKGIGAKKINTIWKEMEIETLGELLYACSENRLTNFKGFGAKTQQNIKEAIEFFMVQSGRFLYQQALEWLPELQKQLEDIWGKDAVSLTGGMRRHADTVGSIDFLIEAPLEDIKKEMKNAGFESPVSQDTDFIHYQPENAPLLQLIPFSRETKGSQWLITTADEPFLAYITEKMGKPIATTHFAEEAALFAAVNLPFIAPEHRNTSAFYPEYYEKSRNKSLVKQSDICGIIHSHSTWSDGGESLEKMAEAARDKGMQYLVISDHSKAAFYASGLSEESIIKQHKEIDMLNDKLAPFHIFKSIECDILNDGSLDYNDEVLSSLDLVIASVHSNLKMTEEKAMQRLLTAIENPYTMILGHMTGRLLLSRKGYPVDHKKIIDACAANRVVIELNAHPRRLDLDAHWIPYAIEKGVLISINPDAHSIEGFDDIKYGVIAAQKALLPASQNLSSFSIDEFNEWLFETRQEKGI
jgi:DNA polymerase (family 10)